MKKEKQTSRELAVDAALIMDEQKAENIAILDVEKACNFTSYFVLATANSTPQLRAMGNKIQRVLRDRGIKPMGVAGADSSSWLVLDYADLVIHVLTAEARDHYRLEDLWQDAVAVEWPKPA